MFYHAIEKIFKDKTLDSLIDYVPIDILKKYSLPTLHSALIWIHKPKNAEDAEMARKRFAFEEVFCIQLERQKDKAEYRKNKSFNIHSSKSDVGEFLKRFLSRRPILKKNLSLRYSKIWAEISPCLDF